MTIQIQSNLRLENDSNLIEEDLWEWSVWVEGSAEELKGISAVTYHLHPTFPHPVHRLTDRETKFRLEAQGWGEFLIVAQVEFSDGRTERLEHWLDLVDPARDKDAARSGGERRPTVFLSHSLFDSALANELKVELRKRVVEAWSAEDTVQAGENVQVSIEKGLDSADAVVAVISDAGAASSVVGEEVTRARRKRKTVLPLVVGSGKVPTMLADLATIRLVEQENVQGLADIVAGRVKDLITP